MCLNPIKLRTSSLYRNPNGYSKYYVEVPCCQCAECQQRTKNDWYIRNYFESEATWSKNSGYVLFDTLTYDDAHIPTVSKTFLGTDIDSFSSWDKELDCLDSFLKEYELSYDIRNTISIFRKCNYTCFDYHDIQNFLKLLRIRLDRSGYDVEDNLRYFIASEYGHDELYVDSNGRTRKGTSRPHYHILFYVKGSLNLSPELLSLFISSAWTNGRTDGIPYKTREYVIGHNVFGPSYITDPNRLRGVQYYVAKYVCKDYDFHDSIDKRINYILTQLFHISFGSPEYRERKRELHRFMDQFHRQSLEFGFDGLISSPDALESIIKDGKIKMPDKEKVVKEMAIPLYYIRKLFQKCVKDAEGKPHWVWNDLGIEWKRNRINDSINLLATRMQDWYSNLDVISNPLCNYRAKVDKILNGRTFREYAEYVILYKGRFCKDPKNPDSRDTIIMNSLSDPYSVSPDLSFKRLDDGSYLYSGSLYTPGYLEYNYVIKDDCLGPRFQGFDELGDLYRVSLIGYGLRKQSAYQEKLALQKRLKEQGLKCKLRI